MTLLSLILSWFILSKPLDYWLYEQQIVQEQQIEQPMFEWTATRYDYKLWWKWWSKNHSTCALRIYERHKKYKVCSKATWKCITCYHNDYWPARTDRVVDLSSYAFKQLWISLSRWVAEVQIYLVE